MVAMALALTGCQGNAQKMSEGDVPQKVKEALSMKFRVNDVDWEKETENYEAGFEEKGKEISVLISADGSILEIEREIKKKELPASVQATLVRDFNGYNLREASVIESNGQLTYEAEVKKGKASIDLIFDVRGNLLKKVPIGAEND